MTIEASAHSPTRAPSAGYEAADRAARPRRAPAPGHPLRIHRLRQPRAGTDHHARHSSLRGEEIPLTLDSRVVGRRRDRLLILGTGRLDYGALRAATEFRLPWTVPAGHLRVLLAADFR